MAQLSGTYANTGQSALAPEWSRKAFELRDRVSERERYFISWRYYRDATQAWDKGLELARSWTAAYPRESIRVQQPRVRGVGARAVSAGDRAASRIDPARSEVLRADVESRVRR